MEALDPSCEIVAIHDGARAGVDVELIGDTVEAARACGAAVAAQRMVDTVKLSKDGVWIAEHLDRSRFWTVQTPQTFRVDVIRRALGEVRKQGLTVTDDTAACGLIGQAVRLVESKRPNPKLTTPTDLAYLEVLLQDCSIERERP
ncbi:MAG: 2-C-methyl-D-erythritol 4-phosphate cytidylyltransferase [Verrucomicrobiota bacterium]|nr:2-C-methyl-D-erythritol 4-phosphate cytidylyltransferase [Verrucomicrobiota bacterium]